MSILLKISRPVSEQFPYGDNNYMAIRLINACISYYNSFRPNDHHSYLATLLINACNCHDGYLRYDDPHDDVRGGHNN
jgi:hypothetical protein